MRTKQWNRLWPEERHLVEVVAAHLNATGPSPVAVGASAAVIHGLPLYRLAPSSVHVLIEDRRHSRQHAGIFRHDIDVTREDITVVDGIRCTTLARTVLDVASAFSPEGALAATDAALRIVNGGCRWPDADLVEDWRGRLAASAAARSTPGIRQARRVIAMADARSDSPGESVSRLQLLRLGFTHFDLQVHVVGSAGDDYWLDFAFEGARCFGEFDGTGKYTDPRMRGNRTMQETLLAEKKREDDVRGVTGWGFGRWGFEHIVTAKVLGTRLKAFGITPP